MFWKFKHKLVGTYRVVCEFYSAIFNRHTESDVFLYLYENGFGHRKVKISDPFAHIKDFPEVVAWKEGGKMPSPLFISSRKPTPPSGQAIKRGG